MNDVTGRSGEPGGARKRGEHSEPGEPAEAGGGGKPEEHGEPEKAAPSSRLLESLRDAVLAALPEAWAVYVYGSFAEGTERPHSDVDLAVLLPPEQEIPDLLETIAKISRRSRREADIVDLRRAGDVLRREVLEKGRSLYVSRPDEVLAWEASALSRYAHYREEIRGILEDFERTGVGYAP